MERPFLHILFLADLLQESSGCVRVNGNLNLSRAIGDLEYKKRSDLPPQEQVICSTPDVVVRVARFEAQMRRPYCSGAHVGG